MYTEHYVNFYGNLVTVRIPVFPFMHLVPDTAAWHDGPRWHGEVDTTVRHQRTVRKKRKRHAR